MKRSQADVALDAMGLVQAVHQYKHDHHGQLITWVSKKRRYKDAVGVAICLASLIDDTFDTATMDAVVLELMGEGI